VTESSIFTLEIESSHANGHNHEGTLRSHCDLRLPQCWLCSTTRHYSRQSSLDRNRSKWRPRGARSTTQDGLRCYGTCACSSSSPGTSSLTDLPPFNVKDPLGFRQLFEQLAEVLKDPDYKPLLMEYLRARTRDLESQTLQRLQRIRTPRTSSSLQS
jgi:hypothetical protein